MQGNNNTSALAAYSWSTTLKLGSTGPAVMELQRFLNSNADTMVSVSGAGSKGFETSYFGPATATAVSKFQVKYRAEILTATGFQIQPEFFGPSSIAKAASRFKAILQLHLQTLPTPLILPILQTLSPVKDSFTR